MATYRMVIFVFIMINVYIGNLINCTETNTMNSINNEQLDITLQQEVNDDMNSTNKKTILKYVQEHLSQKWDENPTYLIAKGVGGVASIAAIIYLIIKHQERQRYAAMMSHMTTDKHSKHVIIYIIIGTLVFIVLIILFSRMFCSRVETKSLDGTVSIQRRTVPSKHRRISAISNKPSNTR